MNRRSPIKRLVRPAVDWFFTFRRTPKPWFLIANLLFALGSSNTRVGWDPEERQYIFQAGNRRLFVARATRNRLLVNGVEAQLAALLSKYLVEKVSLGTGDLVIDVGANIGEFSMACESLGAIVHSFEPDPTEFRALARNISSPSRAHNIALWKEEGIQLLWLANDSGDTTLIEAGLTQESVEVNATTLDFWIDRNLEPSEEIALLKLEAEGAEPEVLQGLERNLNRCKYITVGPGFERGVEQEATLPAVTNFLLSRGFEMSAIHPGGGVALFERTPVAYLNEVSSLPGASDKAAGDR